MFTILGYTFENIWTTCIVSAIHESRNLKQARPKGQYVDLLRRALATPSWEFIDKVYHYIWFLSNYIGEDLFPASKMKWGFFNNGCIQCAEADFQSYGSQNSYVLSF